MSEGDKVLLMKQRQNKLSAMNDLELHSVISKRGDLVIIERSENLLRGNVGHVKRFIDPEPGAFQSKQELAQTPQQTPLVEPVVFTNPKHVVSPAERPTTEPADGSAVDLGLPQLVVNRIPKQTIAPRRSSRKRAEPGWLKTISPERLSEIDSLRVITLEIM